jgi:hypothetical protein
MGLFQTVRRIKRWPVVIPIYDGRRCPDCSALVSGDIGQETHRAWHEAHLGWQEGVWENTQRLAAKLGMAVSGVESDGEIGGLDRLDDDELEQTLPAGWRTMAIKAADNDDRLTQKVRQVLAQNGEYDDENDQD